MSIGVQKWPKITGLGQYNFIYSFDLLSLWKSLFLFYCLYISILADILRYKYKKVQFRDEKHHFFFQDNAIEK